MAGGGGWGEGISSAGEMLTLVRKGCWGGGGGRSSADEMLT